VVGPGGVVVVSTVPTVVVGGDVVVSASVVVDEGGGSVVSAIANVACAHTPTWQAKIVYCPGAASDGTRIEAVKLPANGVTCPRFEQPLLSQQRVTRSSLKPLPMTIAVDPASPAGGEANITWAAAGTAVVTWTARSDNTSIEVDMPAITRPALNVPGLAGSLKS
jgi:hypothetical protein